MYDFTTFGKRLHGLRKDKGMTQEDLAFKIGVSGQAVSKWETGLSYPDITSIPALAEILGTTIQHLFGGPTEIEAPTKPTSFPDSYKNLPLVLHTKNTACYASKTVASTDDSGVKFTDGSVAELTTRRVINRGPGEVVFLSADSQQLAQADFAIVSETLEFEPAHSLKLTSVFNCDCKIIPSPDNTTRVHLKGSNKFANVLEAHVSDGNLVIGNKNDGYETQPHEPAHQLTIELPRGNSNIWGHLHLHIIGQGEVVCELDCFNSAQLNITGGGNIFVHDINQCNIQITGSGDVIGKNAKELKGSINGSGDIKWENADQAEISINGAGDCIIDTIVGANISINGVGDAHINKALGGNMTNNINSHGTININHGHCKNFVATLGSNGTINASGLTADNATITLHHRGEVVLGRVIESVTEQNKQDGIITILNWGAE